MELKENKNFLLDCRDEIDSIDTEVLKLFERRMNVVSEIAKYKYKNNMLIFDPEREKAMKEKNLKKLYNTELSSFYDELLNTFLRVSKDYQAQVIEQMEKDNL